MHKHAFHHTRRQVEFAETDMAGIVHFSHFFRWMEALETDFFRLLGLPMIVVNEDRLTGWPRVRAACEYHAPLIFEDQVLLLIGVKALKIRAVEYAFRFYRINPGTNPLHVATGGLTTVHANRASASSPMASSPLPEELLDRIAEAPSGWWKRDWDGFNLAD